MRIDIRRLRKVVHNIPSLLMGYNIYVDTDKLRLIDHVLGNVFPHARTLADLGGVWNVNGAYAAYAAKKYPLERSILVDTDITPEAEKWGASGLPVRIIKGDFAHASVMREVGTVDVALFFDVLLHQANPSWTEILTQYAKQTKCIVVFNQQYIRSERTIRLTDLSFDEYCALAPKGRTDVYRHVFEHADEIHPAYGKPWRDIHNIFQWGITDGDLRAHMKSLGFEELLYRNFGEFSDLPAFENHAFVFKKV